MRTKFSRIIARTSFMAVALLLAGATGYAACTYPSVASGGIWVYLGNNDYFTITLVNLTDYLLYNSGDVVAIHWASEYQAPFGGVPIAVQDLDGNGRNEQGVPPYSGVTWSATQPMDVFPQYYEGEFILELKGFTDAQGVNHPGPAWPNKFRVWFSPQKAEGAAGNGNWIAIRPEGTEWSLWDDRNKYRSGVWTTPHFPGNPSYPSGGDDLEMRNIMTMSNRYVVATLYSVDNVNVVIVVRQTNWVGPAVPSDADPVAGMDTYHRGWRLDWVENTHDSVPGDCNN